VAFSKVDWENIDTSVCWYIQFVFVYQHYNAFNNVFESDTDPKIPPSSCIISITALWLSGFVAAEQS